MLNFQYQRKSNNFGRHNFVFTMNIFQEIQLQVQQAFPALFGSEVELNKVTINETLKEFEGDITLVVFPLLKLTQKNLKNLQKLSVIF